LDSKLLLRFNPWENFLFTRDFPFGIAWNHFRLRILPIIPDVLRNEEDARAFFDELAKVAGWRGILANVRARYACLWRIGIQKTHRRFFLKRIEK
jgi:hypothetical protein